MRRVITVLAALGVLLHAGAVARHNGVMVTKSLEAQALFAALTIICHSSGTSIVPVSDAGFIPSSEQASDCPICSGPSPAAVVAEVPDLPASALIQGCERIARIAERALERLPSFWPPSRAPPSLA